jgi:uncharacterized protein
VNALAAQAPPARQLAGWLWLLLGLFGLRVFGQLAAVIWNPGFLPPMEEWSSGAIPYPLLLLTQLVILGLSAAVCAQFSHGEGWLARPHRGLGRALWAFGLVYLIVMVIRYGVRMTLYPAERWTGGAIPIFSHWVLAAFALALGRYHSRHGSAPARRRRRLPQVLGIAVTVVATAAWVLYLVAPALLGHALGFPPPRYAVRVERSVGMRTSRGVRLVADVYRPRRAGPAPTILVRLPYSKTLDNWLIATLVGRMWAEHGYNVVIQGVRGRGESGGTHDPLVWEREDGIDTLRWLARQPWFDGRLGMWGGSYFGYTQWVLADQADPGPSALLVQLASTSFYDMFYHGGAFALETGLYWALRSGGTRDVAVTAAELDRGYGRLPLIEADDRAGRDIGFFNDWVSHPERDAYWQAIDGERRWATTRAPVLLMAGWFDPFLPGQLSDFTRIRAAAAPHAVEHTRLIIGPWAHASSLRLPDGYQPRNYRLESLAPSLPWFDRHLKKDPGAPPFPSVRLFVLGENVWRDEQEWPLARTRYTPYFLDGGPQPGVLRSKPPGVSHSKTYGFDPGNPVPSRGGAMLGPRAGIAAQDLTPREDVLSFVTEPFDAEMEITGPVRAVLFVRTTAPSTDFTVMLMDVHPDGRAYNISEGILRASYIPGPHGGRDSPARIEVSMWPLSILIGKGHALRVHVSSSSYPRFDVNPNTGRPAATETMPVSAAQTVFWGGRTPSQIILPVIPR